MGWSRIARAVKVDAAGVVDVDFLDLQSGKIWLDIVHVRNDTVLG